ncbi:MAG: hypothetical protein ACI8Z7_000764 [Candidatus Nanohaloarchaea archaeon]|jgi:hypothetical protein
MSKPDRLSIDKDEMTLEDVGAIYSSVKMKQWEEAYKLFNDFVLQSKKEFGVKHDKQKPSNQIYEEMIEETSKALEIDDYDVLDEHELHHAFMFGSNEEPELGEFKETVEAVLKGERRWESYARESYE